jgi:hypothetical protein
MSLVPRRSGAPTSSLHHLETLDFEWASWVPVSTMALSPCKGFDLQILLVLAVELLFCKSRN